MAQGLLGGMFGQPQVQQPGQAFQDPMQNMGLLGRLQYLQQNNPQALMALGSGMMQGNMGAGFAAAGDQMAAQRERLMAQQDAQNQQSKTVNFFRQNAPEYAQMVEAGMPVGEAWTLYTQQRYAQPGADNRPASIIEYEYGQQNPEYADYIRTKGRDAVLTTPDKKAIFEAEDELPQIDNTLAVLQRALELNPQTAEGFGATSTGRFGTWLPDSMEPSAAGPTREYQDLMSLEAVKTMSETLKGASTDFEMRQFMEIIGDVNKPKHIRERALKRMMELAQRKKQVAEKRVNQLRSGDYYQPDQAPAQGGGEGWQDLGSGVKIRQLP